MNSSGTIVLTDGGGGEGTIFKWKLHTISGTAIFFYGLKGSVACSSGFFLNLGLPGFKWYLEHNSTQIWSFFVLAD